MLKPWLVVPSLLSATASGMNAVRPYNKAVDDGTYGSYPVVSYATEEDLTSPQVNWVQWSPECDDGRLTFITPRGGQVRHPGPMILDRNGDMIWSHWFSNDWGGQSYNFQVQQYQGQDYLTFWLGDDGVVGHGEGVYYMLNSSYDVVHKVDARSGKAADLHEFVITPEGTALLTVYEVVPYNLSEFRAADWSDRPSELPGEEDEHRNYVWDCLIQEVSIDTGDLLFEWRVSEHIDLFDTYHNIEDRGGPERAFDWFHINSILKDELGNYLISARYTHSIVYIDGKNGDILWMLGGKRNQFMDLSGGDGLSFAWQHDARFHAVDAFPEIYSPPPSEPGVTRQLLSLFDNAAEDQHYDYGVEAARGLLLELTYPSSLKGVAKHSVPLQVKHGLATRDAGVIEEKVTFINGTDPGYTVRVVKSYENPGKMRSSSQGSLQVLPPHENQRTKLLVGFGLNAVWTEYDLNGTVLCDAHFGAESSWEEGHIQSYRTYKFPWVGKPRTPPKLAISDDGLELYMSWNGATEVSGWLVQGSKSSREDDDRQWKVLDRIEKEGFETSLELDSLGSSMQFVRVLALDQYGQAMDYGMSPVIDRTVLPALYDAENEDNLPLQLDGSPMSNMLVVLFAIVGVVGAYELMKRWQGWRVGRFNAGRLHWRKRIRYTLLHSEA